MIVLILIVFGLCAGSFVNALVWRVHEQAKKGTNDSKKLSIVNGRSMCTHCKHELASKDLVPVISWLLLRGRCRYCKKPIEDSPIVEIAMGATFTLSYLFWPASLSGAGQQLLFVSWLIASVGLMALLVYDLRWMLLPNRIIYPTLFVGLAGRLAYTLFYAANKAFSLELLALSIGIASGIFYLLFYASKGRWIGFGDVRLGLITGTILGRPSLSLLMIFVSSVLGTLFAVPALLRGNKTLMSKLPYGPFLIVATGFTLLWGGQIIDWYKGLVL